MGRLAATPADFAVAGALLHDFNTEYDDPSPGAEALAGRVAELVGAGSTEVIDLSTSEDDLAARHLYEAEGFRRTEGDGGPLTFNYEMDL